MPAPLPPPRRKRKRKFRQARHHRQHQPAGRRGGVDAQVKDAEMDLAFPQLVRQEQDFRCRAAQAADFT